MMADQIQKSNRGVRDKVLVAHFKNLLHSTTHQHFYLGITTHHKASFTLCGERMEYRHCSSLMFEEMETRDVCQLADVMKEKNVFHEAAYQARYRELSQKTLC